MAKMMKKRGKKLLALVMAFTMIISLAQMSALAAPGDSGDWILTCTETAHQHDNDCYSWSQHEHNEDCYVAHDHGIHNCNYVRHQHNDSCSVQTHEHGDSCYVEHQHDNDCYYFMMFPGCGMSEGQNLTCTIPELNYTCGIERDRDCPEQELICEESTKPVRGDMTCGKEEHKHSYDAGCYTKVNSAIHLDIHIALTAKYILDGVTYEENVTLTKSDYTSGRLVISTPGNVHKITDTDIYDEGQRRFYGTFPVGTYEDPVEYTISLTKDVTFDTANGEVTLPMTFESTVNYWSAGNICESLTGSKGYRDGDWHDGKFIDNTGMDYKLGASEETGTSAPTTAILTIQKNISGIDLSQDQAISFGVYDADGSKVDTINVIVDDASGAGLGTAVLPIDQSYYVVEEGDLGISGYDLATTSSVNGGAADEGVTSDSFTLSDDSSVVFTNAYSEIQLPPPPPPTPETYTVTYQYTGTAPEGAPELPAAANYEEGDAVTVAAAPTLDGWVFSGWDKSDFEMPANDVVIYGSWTENTPVTPPAPTYTLTVKYQGHSVVGVIQLIDDIVTPGYASGDTYTTEAKSFDGYTIGQTPANASGAFTDSDITVTYIYTKGEQPPVNPPTPTEYTLTINKTIEGAVSGGDAFFTFNALDLNDFSRILKMASIRIPAGETTGSTTLVLPANGSYVLEEGSAEDAISGYYLIGTSSQIADGEVKDGRKSDWFGMDADTTVSYTNTYEQILGGFSINKTTTGNTTPADTIFTVTDASGATVATVPYSEFYVDELDPSFATYWVGDLPLGTYTVTESGAEIGGWSLTVTGNDADVEVTENGEPNVDITNAYTEKNNPPVNPPYNPPSRPVYYDLIVNYVDTEGNELADSIQESKQRLTMYSTEQKAIEGYSFLETSGDAVSGVMDSDKEVTYIYEVVAIDPPLDIPDEDPPLSDLPDDPVPQSDLPEDLDIPDEEVPLADVPKTGDAQVWQVLAIISAASLAGLLLSSRKKEEEKA